MEILSHKMLHAFNADLRKGNEYISDVFKRNTLQKAWFSLEFNFRKSNLTLGTKLQKSIIIFY